MIDMELDLLRENPSWLSVLQAYATVFEELAAAASEQADASEQASASTADDDAADDAAASGEELSADDVDNADSDSADDEQNAARSVQKSRRRQPWAPRLTQVDGVEPEELSRIHGRLIAYGLLKCDLADRTAGVVYQLTTESRRALASLAVEAEAGSVESDEISRSA